MYDIIRIERFASSDGRVTTGSEGLVRSGDGDKPWGVPFFVAAMNNRTVPIATVVEESSESQDVEGLPVAPSVGLIGGTLVDSMDRSRDNRTENGAPAVTGGVDGTGTTAQEGTRRWFARTSD